MDAKNERLWFKTNLKVCDQLVHHLISRIVQLGKMYLDSEQYSNLSRIIKELRKSCAVCNSLSENYC